MYTIKEASARSGVGVPLLRAWERRYGVVTPTRTTSGYRLYDDEAIGRLVAMRRLIDDGWAPQQAAARIRDADEADLAALGDAGERPSVPGEAADRETVVAGLVDRVVAAARRLDTTALDAALDECFSTVRFEVAWDSVLAPALRAIGEAWEQGEITVAGEHSTSEAIGRRLAMAFEAAGAGQGAPVLVGLAPGAHHEFGALAFAVAARRAGMPALYLGADLPAESWASAAKARDALAAVIGVPRRADVARAGAVIEQLATARPSMVVAVGGGNAARVQDARAVVLPDSVSDAVRTLQAAIAGEPAKVGAGA